MKIISIFLGFLLFISPVYAGTNYCNDANVVGCWGMEDSGAETDLSSNGEDLTDNNTVGQETTDKKFGSASRDFELSNTEYLSAAEGGSTDVSGADQPISMVAWIKMESKPSEGNLAGIVVKYRSDNNQRQYSMGYWEVNDSTSCFLSQSGTSADALAYGATSLSAGVWYHIACVYDDTDVRIYVNGVLDSNGANNPVTYSSGIHNGSALFKIGAQNSTVPVSLYDGLIDDVAVFDKALTTVEIAEIIDCGLQGDECSVAPAGVRRLLIL